MKKRSLTAFLFLPLAIPLLAQEAGDPRARDEDISATEVAVSVTRDDGGLYHYDYDVISPAANRGILLTFEVDVHCAGPVEARRDLSHLKLDTRSLSRSGQHVPVALGGAAPFGVTVLDEAFWGLFAEPGASRHVVLVSPYAPGPRRYRLTPKPDPTGYDNAIGNPDQDPDTPWTADFTVTGLTRGPACPEREDSAHTPRLAGTLYPNETRTVNELLTYSEPPRDRFHAPVGTTRLTLTVHYAIDIDPDTFEVTVQERDLRHLFSPTPGTSETVTLPLQPGKNAIRLRVKAKFPPPEQLSEEIYPGRSADTDQDAFDVRVAHGPQAYGQAKHNASPAMNGDAMAGSQAPPSR